MMAAETEMDNNILTDPEDCRDEREEDEPTDQTDITGSDTENESETIVGVKRTLDSDDINSEPKKLCVDNDEDDVDNDGGNSALPGEEVSSSSVKTSNDSSTSTKTCPNASTESVKSDESSSKAESNEKESNLNDEHEEEKDIDETTSKLRASGILISLIKKNKKPEDEKEKTEDKEKTESQTPAKSDDDNKKNPLEVGPHLSVTMVNKSSPSEPVAKKMLSLKSASDLLDPCKRSSVASPNTMLNNVVKDSISVSRISKSASGSLSTSSPPSPHQISAAQQHLLASHINFAQSFPRGLPMMPPPLPPPGGGGGGMPGLQPRPMRPGQPGAGSLSDQLNRAASGMADYMRQGLEELLKELSAQGSPEATIQGLQLELEKMQWRHNQELSEMKQNVDIMLKDMKSNLEKETQRALDTLKKQFEVDKQKAITETKKKQWCANCSKEAIFYCCWNTSYCDYPCQQSHWPAHMSTCSQVSSETEENSDQKMSPPVTSTRSTDPLINMSMSGGLPMNIGGMFSVPGMMGGMRPSLPASLRGGVSIRPSVPGHLTISRPYFM